MDEASFSGIVSISSISELRTEGKGDVKGNRADFSTLQMCGDPGKDYNRRNESRKRTASALVSWPVGPNDTVRYRRFPAAITPSICV